MYRFASITLFVGLSSSALYSLPVLYSPWKPLKISNRHGAELMRDSESERIVWVKPPKFGFVELGDNSATKHPNQQLCSALANDLSSLVANREIFSRDLKRITKLSREINSMTYTLGGIKSDVDKYVESYRHPNIAYSVRAIADDWVRNRIKLIDTTHRVDACRNSCKELFEYKSALENGIKAAKKDLDKYTELHLDLVEKIESFSEKTFKVELGIYNRLKSKSLIRNHLFRSERRLFSSFAKKAVLPAGDQTVSYRVGWKKLIETLSLANPSLEFKPIPIRSLRLLSKLIPTKIDDFYLSSLPVFVGFKDASTPLALQGEVDSMGSYSTTAIEDFRAKFTFSLNGICPIVNSSYREIVKDKVLLDDSLKPLYSAALTYSYPVLMPSPVKASFNAVEVLNVLENRAEFNGLVANNVLSRLIDEGDFEGAISLSGVSEPAIKQLLNREAVNRVLAAMATPLDKLDDVSGVAFRKINSANFCGSYECKVASWHLLSGQSYDTARQILLKNHNKQESLSEENGSVVSFTGVSVFDSEARF